MATFTADMAAVHEGQQQSDTGATIDAGNQGQQQDAGADGGQQQQDDQQAQLDGRRGPADVRGAIKAAAEALPEQAQTIKRLGDAYFRAEAYSKVFPKVEDAAAAKTLFDGVGGVEGVSKLMERGQQYDAQDEGLRSGDPAVLDQAFKDFPEGMATLAPHYLDRLAKSNPEAFEATVAPHAMGLLDRAGIPAHIQAMVAETDPARLKNMAGQLDAWMKKNSETIKQTRQQTVAPQDTKFKEQQTALQQKEEAFFNKQVDSEVNTHAAPELGRTADQYAKTYKLNDVQKQRFAASVAQRIVQEMTADDTFKKQDSIRRTSKDVSKVAEFRAAEFKRRLPDAAFKEAQELYGATQRPQNGTGEVKPGGPKAAPGGGPLMVSRALDTADLDMTKDPNGYLFIANKGYRKADGAFVTWK